MFFVNPDQCVVLHQSAKKSNWSKFETKNGQLLSPFLRLSSDIFKISKIYVFSLHSHKSSHHHWPLALPVSPSNFSKGFSNYVRGKPKFGLRILKSTSQLLSENFRCLVSTLGQSQIKLPPSADSVPQGGSGGPLWLGTRITGKQRLSFSRVLGLQTKFLICIPVRGCLITPASNL